MADTSKPADRPVESASAAPGEKRSAARPLARASESGDPAVHQLLAERQTAQMNAGHVGDQGEAGAADKDKAAAEDEVKRLTAELGKLGFE